MTFVEDPSLWFTKTVTEPVPKPASSKPTTAQIDRWTAAYEAADAGSLGVPYDPSTGRATIPYTPPPPSQPAAPHVSPPPLPDNYGSDTWAANLSDSDLTQRINHWPGSDNDPILDRLVSERNQRLDPPGGTWDSFDDYKVAVASFEQNAAIQEADEPEVYGPIAPPAYRLEAAAAEYASLYNFIGPLIPGTREKVEADIRQASEELDLDPDQVLADLNRDLVFRNHQPNGFDFHEDVVEMPRGEWTAAIGPHPELRGIYYGGGAVQGPDGQLYPLVIPTVNDRGNRYNADQYAPFNYAGIEGLSVENHLGEEPGWFTLGTEVGPTRFGDKPSGWDRFFAFWGGTAGYQPIGGQPLRAEGYQALQVSPTGYPSLLTGGDLSPTVTPPPATMPGDPPRVNYVLVEGRLMAVDPAQLDAYNRATRRAAGRQGVTPATSTNIGAVAAGADLAVTIGQGLVTTLRLDDGNNGYYQLVFQENEDGDRRAMLRAYAMTSLNGEINIWPNYVTLDENGELAGTPILFRHPDYDVMSAIPDYNVVQLDS